MVDQKLLYLCCEPGTLTEIAGWLQFDVKQGWVELEMPVPGAQPPRRSRRDRRDEDEVPRTAVFRIYRDYDVIFKEDNRILHQVRRFPGVL